ncbi:uncharacterized protein VTP21DRAFT_1078 [Calcarisporiella thermophila]|uniref:uncharacterized protein n=1 Tax=Calcarisporiella thermophila TaxID=911321 RepID=UPI0037444EB3
MLGLTVRCLSSARSSPLITRVPHPVFSRSHAPSPPPLLFARAFRSLPRPRPLAVFQYSSRHAPRALASYSQPQALSKANGNIPNEETKSEKPEYKTWLDRLPPSVAPYLYLTRLDKPIGTWLLYWPCAWSISMAAYHAHSPLTQTAYMLALFGTGAIVMRGAGCTINDMWDKDLDNKVERTKVRPLASGAVTRFQALVFLGGQLSVGLAVLTQLNWYSICLGASSLSLVTIYPFMKRVTYWPQSVLGLAFNWGALLGWSAMLGSCDWKTVLPLYAGGVCWTLVYDTIYAHQDKRDDVKVGIKSTALLFGNKTTQYLTGFGTSFVSLLALAGFMNGQGIPFYLVSVGGSAAHLAWQLRTVRYEDPKDCWKKFVSNKWLGALVWSGIVADGAWRHLIEMNVV